MAMERWRRERELIPWRPIREIERHFEDIFGRPFFPVTWRLKFPLSNSFYILLSNLRGELKSVLEDF